MRRAVLIPLVAVLLLAPSAAAAPTKTLWATVNVCDTPSFPNAMGVRASMPGNGTKQRMYMRFNATYFDRMKQAWFPVEGAGRSKWVHVGNAKVRARQSGYTFHFNPPTAPGSTFVVRGVVEMEWRKVVKRRKGKRGRKRKREKVVRKVRATTRHGIENVGAGDPPGTSEGLCVISGP